MAKAQVKWTGDTGSQIPADEAGQDGDWGEIDQDATPGAGQAPGASSGPRVDRLPVPGLHQREAGERIQKLPPPGMFVSQGKPGKQSAAVGEESQVREIEGEGGDDSSAALYAGDDSQVRPAKKSTASKRS